jgi:hypothetical protein
VTRLFAVTTLALLVCQACGSAQSPARPHDPGTHQGSGSAGSAGHVATGSGSAGPTEPEHPSEQECDALFAHALAVEQAERPTDQQLAEPELAKVRATLREQKMAACRELPRATYRCMLAAPTLPALTSCS